MDKESSEKPEQPSPRKRDKFAAMAARQQQEDSATAPPADNKQQQQQEDTLQKQQEQQKEQRQKLKERCEQRAAVWKDLERAQAWTIQLLDIAQKTTQVLGKGDISNNNNNDNYSSYEHLSTLSSHYLDTLNDLHSCLEPHAHFVKAYTDQPPPGNDLTSSQQQKNRMYASRVDLRIAKSRKALLQDILELEQQQQRKHDNSTNGDRKRKRGEGA